MLKGGFLAFLFLCLFNNTSFGQCGIAAASTNGWTVSVAYEPTSVAVVAPTPTNTCPWYYQYGVIISYSITFTGSNTSRSVTLQNGCVSCIGGNNSSTSNCTTCSSTLGTFTGNSSGTFLINNNSCQYSNSSGTASNYGSNPNCNTINLNNAGCTSAYIDYSGNGISYTSAFPCAGISPTPISLLNFTVVPTGNTADILWETATEVNNHYFTIEKSTDGKNFTEFAKVYSKAKDGNSTAPLYYQIKDTEPATGTSYYLLKQTDYNNNYKYFMVVPLNMDEVSTINIYPNPSNGSFVVDPSSSQEQTMQVYDITGKLVLSQPINGKTTIGAGILTEGVYNVTLQSSTSFVNKKLVIVP